MINNDRKRVKFAIPSDSTEEVSDAVYSDAVPDGYILDTELSRRRTKVYINCNKVVIAFRGTQLTQKDGFVDIYTDCLLFIGLERLSNRFRKSVNLAYQVVEKYPDKMIILCGHSLGGSIANYVSSITGLPGFSLNSGNGLNYIIPSSYLSESNIENFNTLNDPISMLNIITGILGLNPTEQYIWKNHDGHSI